MKFILMRGFIHKLFHVSTELIWFQLHSFLQESVFMHRDAFFLILKTDFSKIRVILPLKDLQIMSWTRLHKQDFTNQSLQELCHVVMFDFVGTPELLPGLNQDLEFIINLLVNHFNRHVFKRSPSFVFCRVFRMSVTQKSVKNWLYC